MSNESDALKNELEGRIEGGLLAIGLITRLIGKALGIIKYADIDYYKETDPNYFQHIQEKVRWAQLCLGITDVRSEMPIPQVNLCPEIVPEPIEIGSVEYLRLQAYTTKSKMLLRIRIVQELLPILKDIKNKSLDADNSDINAVLTKCEICCRWTGDYKTLMSL